MLGAVLFSVVLATARAEQPESNRRMAERLAELGKDYDRRVIAQRPDLHLARYLRHVDKAVDVKTTAFLDAKKAYEQLLAGESGAAAEGFQKAKDAALAHPKDFDANFLPVIRGYLAVSYLRQGEQANCCSMYGPRSCLLPIEGAGVHAQQEGSRAAIREYLELLETNPGDMTSRWLLNIAYMTVGEHPEKVPERWLIPPEKFAPEGAFPSFTNVAPSLDLGPPALAGGVVMDDFNGDGKPDLLISSSGLYPQRDQLRYFENKGDGAFEERTETAGLVGLTGGMNLLQADYDNDGHLDVLVLRGGGLLGDLGDQPPSLLRNRGDGTFEDVTEAAGLYFEAPTQCGAWGDYDNDGRLDLLVGIESSKVAGFDVPLYQDLPARPERACKLFHNQGNGKFSEVAKETGLEVTGYVKGAAWGDLDNDGFPELAVAQGYGPCLLFANRPETKKKRKFAAPERLEPAHSSSVVFFDYDQDGWLDLFVAGYSKIASFYAAGQVAADLLGQPHTAELPRLYHNDKGRLRDVTAAAGLGHVYYATGVVAGDFDNDGWPDLYLSTGASDYRALLPKRLLRNLGGEKFEDVSSSAGIAHLQKGSAVALGDVDGDGDEDILQVLGGEFPGDIFPRALFLNPGGENHWLHLELTGTKTNRSAIGARIAVEVETPHGARTMHTVVSSGGSYGGSTLAQEIGLGDVTSIKSVEVAWPASGAKQRFAKLPLDQRYRIVEGKNEAQPAR
ncbi:MAG: FG-GAP-like repeat-containing protein [Chthoniobacterales bacterium]